MRPAQRQPPLPDAVPHARATAQAGHSAAAPAISIRDLVVIRGKRTVLPGLTLDVPRGQVVGLLGPSGGGKTTLLRGIVGVQIIHSGTIEVLGRPAGSADLRRKVGYMTQAPSVYGDLTVWENLQYFGALADCGARRIAAVLEQVDLVDHAADQVANLSGGQRSRVSLAVALLPAPELLVLDEPTVGLDPLLRRSLWELFARLAGEGVTLLVSSHVMDEAARCDRLVLLSAGRILADDSPAGLEAATGTTSAEAAFLALESAAR
ncbi:MAG: ABC transporter ATP-binding protein [Bifidobacteriaceae bacterium]|jgi:ABC-2 type transport system ATP-binding protein|nr:ABC transporter ATP-binding protein [Bifidobacteriaceae bacterium]